MGQIWVLASWKGGVGKTTLTCNLACELAHAGLNVAIVDTDSLKNSANWLTARAEHENVPQISLFMAKAGKVLLKTMKELAKTYDVVMVDLKGVESDDNKFTMSLADKVIFPFKVGQGDLDTLADVTEAVEQVRELNPNCQFVYVINEAPFVTKTEVRDAQAYFRSFNVEAARTVVYVRKAYRDSMATGFGVRELGNDKAQTEMADLLMDIMQPQAATDEEHAVS